MRKTVSNPMVSIVIPTYNRAADIPRCLDSLMAQDFQDFEVLICDDGSTDDTSIVVAGYEKYLDITYIYCENFGGPARPRNRGIEKARAPYIAFLDSDDWWMPNKLKLSLDALNKGADIVYHDLYIVTTAAQRSFRKIIRSRKLKSPVFDQLLAHGNALNNSSVVVKKNLLIDIGLVSEEHSLIGIEDYDTWLRIAKLTSKFERIPYVLGFYWLGGGNISSEDRYIKLLQAIKQRYALEIIALGFTYNFYWIKYAEGRYYFKRRNFDLARKFLAEIDIIKTPFAIYFKSLLMLLMIKFRK